MHRAERWCRGGCETISTPMLTDVMLYVRADLPVSTVGGSGRLQKRCRINHYCEQLRTAGELLSPTRFALECDLPKRAVLRAGKNMTFVPGFEFDVFISY